MQKIIEAAESKFGTVKAIKESKTSGYFILLISRETPVFYERPYMTIAGYAAARGIAFEHGHYDLGWNEAQADYDARK